MAWAASLNKLDFTVDVCDYRMKAAVDWKNYSIVCGFSESLEQSIRQTSPRQPVRIFYGTGCSPIFSNKESACRIVDFHDSTGIWAPSSGRFVQQSWPLQMAVSDSMVVLGNDVSKATYQAAFLGQEIACIPAFWMPHARISRGEQRRIVGPVRNVLWFGSSGIAKSPAKNRDLAKMTFDVSVRLFQFLGFAMIANRTVPTIPQF